jgi:hypothetical protein
MQQFGMTMSGSQSTRDPEQEELEQKLIEGMQSPSVPVGKDFWIQLRRTAHARTPASPRPRK